MDYEKYYNSAKEYLHVFNEFLKAVWEQPHSRDIFIAIIILIVAFIVVRKIKNHFRPIRLFNNSLGFVEVSPAALDDLVQSVCYGMGSLSKPIVKIYTRRGRLSMKVSIKLESGQKLAEVSSALQEELTRACREHLGVEKLGRIDIKIRGFKGLLKKPTITFKPIDEENTDSAKENDPFAVRE